METHTVTIGRIQIHYATDGKGDSLVLLHGGSAAWQAHAAFDVATLFPRITYPTLLLQGDPMWGGLITDNEVARGLSLLPDGYTVRRSIAPHAQRSP